MIEAVGASSTTSASLRSSSSAAVSAPAVQAEPVKAISPSSSVLYVRVNNDLNRAILEARSKEGDVVRQYPSEYQIRAIQLASSLETKKPEQKTPDYSVSDLAATNNSGEAQQVSSDASAPKTSAPVRVDIPSDAAVSVQTGKTTQSIVV